MVGGNPPPGGKLNFEMGRPDDEDDRSSDLEMLTAPSDDSMGEDDDDPLENDGEESRAGEDSNEGTGYQNGDGSGGGGGDRNGNSDDRSSAAVVEVEDKGAMRGGAWIGNGKNEGDGGVALEVREGQERDGGGKGERLQRMQQGAQLNKLVAESAAKREEQEYNVAFVKTHKTASTTLTAVIYRYGLRHDRTVARFDVEGTAVTLEHAAKQVGWGCS